MKDIKILLTYKDDNGNYQIESVWATKEGNYYRINNIPFLAPNIALNDLVSAEEDDDALYFNKLIMSSGHSTVQIIFLLDDSEIRETVEKDLLEMGCSWEESHRKDLISVDIPPMVSYSVIKKYLDKGESKNLWSYKEACLSH